jgi:hypothetical protein
MKRASLVTLLLLVVALVPAQLFANPVAGAIFTSGPGDPVCSGTNLNHYVSKLDVYLNGGPAHPGAAGLTPGNYYLQVTDPSGAVVLGSSLGMADETPVHVPASGEFACLHVWDYVHSTTLEPGYDDTPNAGGVYKVWVSLSDEDSSTDADRNFTNSDTKTDNFQVKETVTLHPNLGLQILCDDDTEGCVDNDVQPANFLVGQTISYPIVVTNTGDTALSNIVVHWKIYKFETSGFNDLPKCDGSNTFTSDPFMSGDSAVIPDGLLAGESGVVDPVISLVADAPVHYYLVAYATGDYTGGAVESNHAACWPAARFPNVVVQKFYDTNTNGSNDAGDCPIGVWAFSVCVYTDSTKTTLVGSCLSVDSGDTTELPYAVSEPPLYVEVCETSTSGWVPTAGLCRNANLTGDISTAIGNVRLTGGGGLTLGFWSNKNGQALVGSTDLAMLVALNLRNGNGSDFNPGNYSSFRSWILSATATNMAYMLSAQLAAMELNVFNGFVNGGALIYAPGATSANSAGFATVDDVMTEANNSLGSNGNTVASGPTRTYQEALKNALDRANNNLNFLDTHFCTP